MMTFDEFLIDILNEGLSFHVINLTKNRYAVVVYKPDTHAELLEFTASDIEDSDWSQKLELISSKF